MSKNEWFSYPKDHRANLLKAKLKRLIQLEQTQHSSAIANKNFRESKERDILETEVMSIIELEKDNSND
jgi:hypothetical protein